MLSALTPVSMQNLFKVVHHQSTEAKRTHLLWRAATKFGDDFCAIPSAHSATVTVDHQSQTKDIAPMRCYWPDGACALITFHLHSCITHDHYLLSVRVQKLKLKH